MAVDGHSLNANTWRGSVELPWTSLRKVYRVPFSDRLVLVGTESRIVIPPDVRIQSWHAFMWLVMKKIEASGLEIQPDARAHYWRTRRF